MCAAAAWERNTCRPDRGGWRAPPGSGRGREQQQADVLEGVRGEHDDRRVEWLRVPSGIDVVDAAGAPLRVGGHAQDAAIRADLEVAGRQRLRDESQVDGRFGVDMAAVKRVEAAIGASRTAVVRDRS